MIKCNMRLFGKQEVEIKGAPSAVYAELVELITVILSKLNKEYRQRFERQLRDDATWKMINSDVISRKLNKE